MPRRPEGNDMERIIAGRFETKGGADVAAASLAKFVVPSDIFIFHNNDRRPAGILLSVRVAKPQNEGRVIAALREKGAADIERADGTWSAGEWSDFDPVARPQLVTAPRD
jgi:hypothetical protein